MTPSKLQMNDYENAVIYGALQGFCCTCAIVILQRDQEFYLEPIGIVFIALGLCSLGLIFSMLLLQARHRGVSDTVSVSTHKL